MCGHVFKDISRNCVCVSVCATNQDFKLYTFNSYYILGKIEYFAKKINQQIPVKNNFLACFVNFSCIHSFMASSNTCITFKKNIRFQNNPYDSKITVKIWKSSISVLFYFGANLANFIILQVYGIFKQSFCIWKKKFYSLRTVSINFRHKWPKFETKTATFGRKGYLLFCNRW